MVIKKLTIESFDGLTALNLSFDEKFVRLDKEVGPKVLKALSILLKLDEEKIKLENTCKTTKLLTQLLRGESEYEITAIPGTKEWIYTITKEGVPVETSLFYANIQKTHEERDLSIFRTKEKKQYSRKMLEYKDYNSFYAKNKFFDDTNGIGLTPVFRNNIRTFLKKDLPSSLLSDKELQMEPTAKGQYVVTKHQETVHPMDLSETDKKSFEYQCFIKINSLWREVNEIQTMHPISFPLFLCGMDAIPFAKESIELALKLNRQVFLIDEESVKK